MVFWYHIYSQTGGHICCRCCSEDPRCRWFGKERHKERIIP
uniref:Uncharacterized protein n=1 Tax=Rhizophora mucronata TaxID=61149 RepID=A0A2P2R5A1_RHIMU